MEKSRWPVTQYPARCRGHRKHAPASRISGWATATRAGIRRHVQRASTSLWRSTPIEDGFSSHLFGGGWSTLLAQSSRASTADQQACRDDFRFADLQRLDCAIGDLERADSKIIDFQFVDFQLVDFADGVGLHLGADVEGRH